MASTGKNAPKQDLWIVVGEERSHGYFHLHARVTTDRYENGQRYPYGLDDEYSFEGKPLLSGLRASCQGDERSQLRPEGAVYGFGVAFKDRYRPIELNDAARMVKTLTRVQKGLEKLSDARGYVKTYGEYLGRLAEVLGCKGIALQREAEYARQTGNDYEWCSIGEGVNRVNHRIYLWHREVADRQQPQALPAASMREPLPAAEPAAEPAPAAAGETDGAL
jgi:hypothetical protein